MKINEQYTRSIIKSDTFRIIVDYTYIGKVTKLRLDFKNKELGFRWHLITVKKSFFDCWLTSHWISDGEELVDLYLSDEDYFCLCITKDLSFFDHKLDLTSLNAFSQQVV
jgi:hypothetical protein